MKRNITLGNFNELLDENQELKLLKEKKETVKIKKLSNRAAHCVCKYCGGKLSLRKATYAAYDEAKIDIYCQNCGRIENGTEPLIYKMAAYFVDDMQFDYYPELNNSLNKRRMNIGIVCDIIDWGFLSAGYINEDGFQVQPLASEHGLTEATVITREELEKIMKG